MNEPNETIALSGPDNGRWHFTQIPDWIALCPDLKDGAFRLYVILRSLVVEKQDDHVRLLTHDEIAYMMVGKSGKPSTVSTIKALLRNLEDVGLIEHPDGSRMASPTGRGNPHASLRYRLNDWPDRQRYAGWRNAFDKLDWYSKDWTETRDDIASTDYAAWLAGEEKTSPPRKTRDRGEQKASPQANKNTRPRRSFSSQDSPVTSNNAAPNKSLQQASPTSSSSSAEVEDVTPDVVAKTPKKTKMMSKSQEREQAKTLIAQRLPDSTPEERDQIIDLVYAEAATQGRKIGFIASYIGGRPDSLLEQDLAQVRRHASAPPTSTVCSEHGLSLASGKCSSCEGDMNTGDFEVVRKILERDGAGARPDLARRLGRPQASTGRGGGYQPYRNPEDQDVYDEPLLVPSSDTDFSGDF